MYKKAIRSQKENAARKPSSADPPASPAPLSMIRLVVQFADTPKNRAVMASMQEVAKSTKVEGPHATIKREDVQILAVHTTRPKDGA